MDAGPRVVLIAQNPKSGAGDRGKLVNDLALQLQQAGLLVQIIQEIDVLVASVESHLEKGELHCVVAAGGDGTVSLLVNVLPPGTALFVFPLGTANLLAKYLKVDCNVANSAASILGGRTVTMDIGQANDRLFVVVASVGFDADVVHRIHARRKGHISYASYFVPVMQSIFGYPFSKMKLNADGHETEGQRWAFIFNVPKYAVGLQLTKNAQPTDGRLDYCCFSGGGFWVGMYYFFSVLLGRHEKLKSASLGQFETVEISSMSDTELPVELDGDPAGHTPVTIQVIPDRLTVVVAEDWDGLADA